MKRFLSLVLTLVMMVSVLGPAVFTVQSSATQSHSANFSGSYTLTGNGAADIVAVAFAQQGKTGSQLGYTEEWCADFVGDCSKLAGQQIAVPLYGGVKGLRDRIINAGGYAVSKADARKGDIAFYDWNGAVNAYEHVEIVYSEAGSPVATIGGNTGDGSDLYTRHVSTHNTNYCRGRILEIVRPNYKSNTPKYTVTFKDWDGTVLKTQTVTSGGNATPPSNPSRTGYTFTGWSGAYTNVTSNWTVTALYLTNTYDNAIGHFLCDLKNGEGNNGDEKTAFRIATTRVKCQYKSTFVLSASQCPAPLNGIVSSECIGTSSVTGSWEEYPFGTTFTQKPNDMRFDYCYHPTKYTITYDLAGGTNAPSNPETYNVLYGVTLANPTREGHTFNGWYNGSTRVTGINEGKNMEFLKGAESWAVDSEKSQQLYSELARRQTGNVKLTAKWTPYTYTVTFKDWNDTVLKTQTVNYGANATPPPNPSRTGYTFTGWNGTYTNITSNRTITAQYKLNPTPQGPAPVTYTVTLKDNGDGTATITAALPAGAKSGKIVVGTSAELAYVGGSLASTVGAAGGSFQTNEKYDRDGVAGVCVSFVGQADTLPEGTVVLSADYAIAEGAELDTDDFFVRLWNLADKGGNRLGTEADGDVVKVYVPAPRYLPGDVNFDGCVDNIDASLILQYDAELMALSQLQMTVADVNADGCVDNIDASLILQFDAGIIGKF